MSFPRLIGAAKYASKAVVFMPSVFAANVGTVGALQKTGLLKGEDPKYAGNLHEEELQRGKEGQPEPRKMGFVIRVLIISSIRREA